MKPLQGVRILDLSHSLAGPFASMLLANLGARVIKIEPPAGDETRSWGPHVKGESAYFISTNRGVKSICIDLKMKEGQKIVHELAQNSDVVIENFRPGIAEKLGVDYQELLKHNPRIVYCSIKGFGSKSHYSSRGAYDLIIQAMSGLMATTGEEGRTPVRVSFALFDVMTGMLSGIYVLAVLLGGDRPSYIEVSLFDAAVFSMCYVPTGFLLTGKKPPRVGSANPSMAPYQAFRDRDGRYFVMASANDKLWKSTCAALGELSLERNPDFSTNPDRIRNRGKLAEILQERFSTQPREYWIELLEEAGVPAGPVNDIDEVFQDPWIRDSGLVTKLDHKTLGEIPFLQPPAWVNGERLGAETPSPTLGEDTDRVLTDLGYSEDAIRSLRDTGAIR